MELEPWVVVRYDGSEPALATWRISSQEAESLVLFSERSAADAYAQSAGIGSHQTAQLVGPALVRVLADCHLQGIRFATLDPTVGSAQTVFVISDVLRSARKKLHASRTTD